MADTIPTAFVKKYEANITLLVTQIESYFRSLVTIKTITPGQKLYIDYVAAITPQKVTGRHADTPIQIPVHSRRRIVAEQYVGATLIDKADVDRMLSDPAGAYMNAFRAGFMQKIDTVIATAAIGNSYSVETEDETETAIALPSSQKVTESGTVGMTLQKVREALKILNTNDVALITPKFMALSPQAIYDLQGEPELTDAESMALKVIQEGKIDRAFGFNLVMSNRLSIASNIRSNFAWTQDGIGLGLIQDLETSLTIRNDKNMARQPYMSMDFGATRLQEKLVVEVQGYEAP